LPEVHQRLEHFVALLLEANQRVNLTGIRTPVEVWPLHILDSLAALAPIRAAGASRILDLGAGGGVPGIPLACAMPELHVTLLDATARKIKAVRGIIDSLGLTNVEAIAERAETLAHSPAHRERYDGLTARAVAPLRVLVEYASGFVRPDGVCWFYKSCDTEQEQAAAAGAATECRLIPADSHRYSLPAPHGDRLILSYRKTALLPPRLPRQPGTPAQRPL
jgi:16S rRNA (guanine527-N7)-methyltransferase